jgi:hypothetical protein
MLINAKHSDRTQERYYHTLAAIGLAFIGYGLLGISIYATDNIYVRMVALSIAAAGVYSGIYSPHSNSFVVSLQ